MANVTAGDIAAFLDLAARAGIRPEVRTPLEHASAALRTLHDGGTRGATVLSITDP